MSAETPEELSRLFEKHFNARDLDALVDLYEADAVLVNQDGSTQEGREVIRAEFEAMFRMPGTMTLTPATAVVLGDLSLNHVNWTLEGEHDGQPMRVGGRTAEVCRRQADGTWKYIIDNPFVTFQLG